ncbi:uncharacterized protein LOC113214864 isoform X2 [Frankliniella occidentalis]|uniref:Uncharacterized protein LOC113214864 isoform X2 n=1 Tax=Frankliniella occidentalis TaxID=133901 RepID=A0A9C6WVE2_FRAOC|nr:uncharacterized protein LOC113214864 isoform X2 [Frankliniella occidentalis]
MEDHFTYGPCRGPCAVCGQPGAVCARCRVAFYCGKDHQRMHWKLHKPVCGCLEVRTDERVGRHIVAIKDIPARTILMRELPLVVFPFNPTQALLQPDTEDLEPIEGGKVCLCVACCMKVDNPIPCVHCGWPLCKRSCPHLDRHSTECAAFQMGKYKYHGDITSVDTTDLDLLAAIRIWLASHKEKERGPRLLKLQHEIPAPSAKKGTVDAAMLKKASELFWKKVLSTAVRALLVMGSNEREANEGIKRALGSSLINSFGSNHGLNNRKGEYSGAALYAGLSLLEHSCVPNARTAQADGDSDAVILVASRDIAAGEHVTISYHDNPLANLHERWVDNATRGFVCRCELCEDPTEKGTYFNAWCCTTCKRNDRKNLVTLVGAFGWRCKVCKASGPNPDPAVQELQKSFRHLQVLMALDENPAGEGVQRLWQGYIDAALWPKGPLHPTHHLVVKAAAELLTLGDNVCPPRQPATLREAAYLVEHCRKLLDVIDVLRPPINTYRREVVMYLFNFNLEKLLLHRGQRQSNTRTLKSTIDKLKKELSDLLADIRHISISQRELETCERLQTQFGLVSGMASLFM